MRRQILHNVVAIALALPILALTLYQAAREPWVLNPWNHEFFGGLWAFFLPAFVASAGIVVNGVLGFFAARSFETEATTQTPASA